MWGGSGRIVISGLGADWKDEKKDGSRCRRKVRRVRRGRGGHRRQTGGERQGGERRARNGLGEGGVRGQKSGLAPVCSLTAQLPSSPSLESLLCAFPTSLCTSPSLSGGERSREERWNGEEGGVRWPTAMTASRCS
eukprot:3100476-Rhodomonas_salina.1